MNIHHPIQQVTDKYFLTSCPNCGFKQIQSNGTVDTPPIAQQIVDTRMNVERRWLAQRCYCSNCNKLWDVVEVNQIVGLKK